MKLTQSYEKTALSLAVLCALGLGTALYVDAGKLARDFPTVSSPRSGQPAMTGEAQVTLALHQLGEPVADAPRGPAAFTGPREFMLPGGVGPIDLSDPRSAPVHPPIPNPWWGAHGIDPGFADAPQRDADGDGFSNLEEFTAKTDPRQFSDHPPLLRKLRVATLEEDAFAVTYAIHSCVGAPKATDRFGFSYRDRNGLRISQNEIPAGRGAASTFFDKGPQQLRFELKSVQRKPGAVRATYRATLIDRSANKQGLVYQVEKGSRTPLIVRDFRVTLLLDAIGQGDRSLELAEGDKFSLPFDGPGAGKPYRFKEVQAAAGGSLVVIEVPEGDSVREVLLPAP